MKTENDSKDDLIKEIQQLNRRITLLEGKHRRFRQMEDALRVSRDVFNSLHSFLISVDCNGVVTRWNAAVERFTGIPHTHPRVKRARVWELIPFLEAFQEGFHQVINSGQPLEVRRFPIALPETQYFDVSIYPVEVKKEIKGAVIEIEDKTELVKKDQQLMQAQKMETVGNLAGGLAHDFNNVLAGITGAVSLLKYYFENRENKDGCYDKIKRDIAIIEKSAGRATEMVAQLLTLSRKNEPSLKPTDLNDALAHIENICRNTFDKRIELEFRRRHHRAVVMADAVQIEQVLLNLCVNAAHSMTDMRPSGHRHGGKLTVSIHQTYPDDLWLAAHPTARDTGYWLVEVADTGVGMSPETIARIFDPFFTTKEKGKGTGLGMTMVYNIVTRHDAIIEVASREGSGSVFGVYFPMMPGEHDGTGEETAGTVFPRGAGLILLVDDEDAVRETAAEMLENCGYNVIVAPNGVEALRVFNEKWRDIDVVVLDMAMPMISGKETYMQMKRIAPEVKVLMASGSGLGARIDELKEMGLNGFIQKPYSLETLTHMVHRIRNDAAGNQCALSRGGAGSV